MTLSMQRRGLGTERRFQKGPSVPGQCVWQPGEQGGNNSVEITLLSSIQQHSEFFNVEEKKQGGGSPIEIHEMCLVQNREVWWRLEGSARP